MRNILKIQAFQRTTKFIEMKNIVILVKVIKIYEICNILKSLLASGYWSRDEVGIGCSKIFDGAFTTPLLY